MQDESQNRSLRLEHEEQLQRLRDSLRRIDRAEGELAKQRSEIRAFSAVLDQFTAHIPDVLWIFTQDLRETIYASPGLEKIWEISREELLENPAAWSERVHPDERQGLIDAFSQMPADGSRSFNFRFVDEDGEVRKWLRASAFLVENQDGPDFVAGLTSDVTEEVLEQRRLARRATLYERRHKAAGQELTNAQLKYNLLFENSNDGIVIFDLDGHIIDCNSRAVELFARPYDEICGTHWPAFVHPRDLNVAYENWEKRLRGEAVIFEMTLVDGEGNESFVEVSSSQVDLGDSRVIQAIVRDHTEQRLAQRELDATRQQLWRAQKMESLGRLAGSIAHDFNNLLSVISSCSSFLLEDLDADDPRRDDALDIREAAEQSAALTRQLLAFSRQQVLESRVVHLDSVLSRTGKLCRRVIDAPIDLDIQLDAGDLEVFVDSGQLEQVIMNLVLNARDAVEGGGRIEIQTRYETVGAAAPGSLPPGGYGVISVRDDGVGIERDDIERIFEPFYTTKEDGKGTGLGLATVHGIVTQSGGYVDVDSTPGQGSEFTIWLPEATEEQRDLEFSELEGAQARSEQRATILLVDDNALVRRSLVRGLERGGYRTLTAANGREALDMWRRHDSQIAAVVSDVIMPAMDGLELLATLKEQAPEMPVFLLTGYAEERDLGAESRRADEILRKPISPAKLCDALSAHLAKEAGEGWAPVA